MYRVRFIHSERVVYKGADPKEALAEWTMLNTLTPCVVLETPTKRLWWTRWKHIKPYDLPLSKEEVISIYGLYRF